MPLMWFLAGVVTTIACMVVVSPWLRTWPRLATLPAARWPISSVAILVAVAAMLLALRSGGPGDVGAAPLANAMASVPAASAPANGSGALSESSGSFGTAAKVFGAATGSALSPGSNSAGATAKAGAGSMDTAVASLEGRLAKGGGTPGDLPRPPAGRRSWCCRRVS